MAATAIQSLGELRRQIADARTRKQLERLTELRHRMIVARVEGVYRLELTRLMQSAEARVASILATATPDDYWRIGEQIDAILSDLENALHWYFETKVYEQASKSLQDSQDDLLLAMTPAMLRATTGLPIDDTGAIKPKPGPVPDAINDSTLSLPEILLRISPLLIIAGDTLMRSKVNLREVIFGGQDVASSTIKQSAETVRPDVSDHWRRKIQYLLTKLKESGREARNAVARAESPQKLIPDFRRSVESTRENLLMELQHEGMRTNGDMQQRAITSIGTDTVQGYTLHSRFAATTAPDHAARDGWKFYKDDRPGGALPWAQRLIPPYRKNCLCFTIPIIQDPDGPEYHAEFGLRISGGKIISIRDVGTWQEWFDRQPAHVQKKLMGERRWFAAASKGLGQPRWSQFVRPDGKHLSVRSILNESQEELVRRMEKVNIISKIQHDRFTQAWREGFGKFDMNQAEEAAYRKRLDVLLRRALQRAKSKK